MIVSKHGKGDGTAVPVGGLTGQILPSGCCLDVLPLVAKEKMQKMKKVLDKLDICVIIQKLFGTAQ